jgi:hemerythrin-like domain-containing protein
MMDDTKMIAALNTVEQDHRLVLERMQALKETVNFLMYRKIDDVRPVLLQLREYNKYFATEFICHSEEEEATLFPLLEQYNLEGKDVVARLRAEHDRIRRSCEEFDNSLQVAIDLEDGLNKTVLRDVFIYGWRLWELLDDHARVETQMIHQLLENAFPKGVAVSRH